MPCYCGAPSCTGYIGEKAFYDATRSGNLHGLSRVAQKYAKDLNSLEMKDDFCFVCVFFFFASTSISFRLPFSLPKPQPETRNPKP